MTSLKRSYLKTELFIQTEKNTGYKYTVLLVLHLPLLVYLNICNENINFEKFENQ